MKRILVIGVVFCLFCTVALAQDNPVPSVGTVGGSVLGTNNEAVPYIFGNGTSMYVKAQVDLSSIGLRRPLADLGIVFDTDGSFFLNTILSGGATNSGITKFSSTGAVLWTNKMPNGGGGGIAGTEPIVGGDYLYSQTLNSATNAVYALNKSTGATAWGVNLDSAVNMTPTLSDGYLYGVESNNEAFAINASTGAVAYQQAVAGISTQSYSRPIFIANAFGSGQNGMFWQGGSATYGMSISHTGASSVWSQPYSPQGYWSYSNVYDPVANQIYRNATNDAGVEGIDPQTGNVLWTWSSGSQGYDNMAVAPGGGLLVSGGQTSGVLERLNTTATSASVAWSITVLGVEWPACNRTVMVTDPNTGKQVWIVGVDGNGSAALHTLDAIDPATGNILWTYALPSANDLLPGAENYGGSIWRNLSMSPNGDLVFMMFDAGGSGAYGANGSLYIVSAIPALLGDTNGDGVVGLADLNNVLNNFGKTGVAIAGDTNHDGVVGLADLNNVLNNFGKTSNVVASTPEPATMALLALGGLGLIRRNRK